MKACTFKLIVHCSSMAPKELELYLAADFPRFSWSMDNAK